MKLASLLLDRRANATRAERHRDRNLFGVKGPLHVAGCDEIRMT